MTGAHAPKVFVSLGATAFEDQDGMDRTALTIYSVSCVRLGFAVGREYAMAFHIPAGKGLPSARVPSTVENDMERETRIELATNSLEGCDSTIELLPREAALSVYWITVQ